MKPIYSVQIKKICGRQYLAGYTLSREVEDTTVVQISKNELSGPLPVNLVGEDGELLWVIKEDGTLQYDPAPIPPEIQMKKELSLYQDYLNQTDWYIIRKLDNGKEPPNEVIIQRERARKRISEIRTYLKSFKEDI